MTTGSSDKSATRRTPLFAAVCALGGFLIGFLFLAGGGDRLDTGSVGNPASVLGKSRNPVSVPAPRRNSASAPEENLAHDELMFPGGAVPGEVVLRFANSGERDAFLKRARDAGIDVLGVLAPLNSVRLRSDDYAKLGRGDAAFDFNYVVQVPEIPETRMPDGRTYAGFGNSALEWLGADLSRRHAGSGVIVALLDTGVDPTSPVAQKLMGRLDVLGGTETAGDYAGHGTAIATLLLGESADIPGIAPGASVLSVRVLSGEGVGDSFTLAQGIIESVERGARILSLSLGSFSDSQIVRDAIAYAQQRNAVVVAAAGNEASDVVSYPARYAGVVAVTATDANRQVPYFSNRGPEVALAAPGVGIITRWDRTNEVVFSGTSAAVPFVSGAIAGVLAQEPQRTGADAARLLVQYSDDAGAPGADSIYGAGILNLGRVAERNQSGIYRLAMADQYLDQANATGSAIPVIVSAQNRGTAPLQNVYLHVAVNGAISQQYAPTLAPGRTASYTVNVPRAASPSGTVRISSWAEALSSGTVAQPITSTLTFSDPAKP